MLHAFLTINRTLLIERCRLMVASRSQSKTADSELAHGIPIFLDQLIKALTVAENGGSHRLESTGEDGGSISDVGEMAALHGRDLLEQGFTLEQVVRDYGDVCQAVTNLAFETKASIAVDEFRIFNGCLDNAIAGAVTEYARHPSVPIANETHASHSQLGALANELRNHLQTVSLVFKAIKAGNVGISGATGAVLDRSLLGMHHLVEQSLVDVRLTAGVPPRFQLIHLAELLGEVHASALLDAQSRGARFSVTPIENDIAVYADPDMLSSTVENLLHNAFQFTERHTDVRLRAQSVAGRVLIDIEDHCGGLPTGAVDRLFLPFKQSGENRPGIRLGLDICRRAIEANHGALRVRDVPGLGCIFTIDLPRHVDFQ